MKKMLKSIFLIVLASFAAVAICGVILFSKMAASMGAGNAGVADFDKRIEIWKNPAGYSSELKIDNMNAGTKGNVLLQQILFASSIVNAEYKDAEHTIDSLSMYELNQAVHDIPLGSDEETHGILH